MTKHSNAIQGLGGQLSAMFGSHGRGKRSGPSLIESVRVRVEGRILSSNREESERIRLLIGSMQSRLVRQATYASVQDAEFTIFSQSGEDGIIQYLLSKVSVDRRIFVEVGVEDYREANTRFLLMNDYWRGLIVDGGTDHMHYLRTQKLGWQYDIRAVSAFVTRDNINQLLDTAGFTGDIGLFSLDIDGNDYWVLKAINVVSPRIVVVEYNSGFGPTAAVTVPYDPGFTRTRAHYSNLYYGASLSALALLMQDKGYALVGSNRAGSNAFFVRRDVLGSLEPRSAAECYVESPIADSRGPDGSLTYIRDMAERVALIRDLPVYSVHDEAIRPLGAVLVGTESAARS